MPRLDVSGVPVSAEGRGFLERRWSLVHAGRLKRLDSYGSSLKVPTEQMHLPADMKVSRQKTKSFSFSDLFI